MTALGLILCLIPLCDLLGYESSAAVGALVALVGPLVWLSAEARTWGGAVGQASDLRPSRVWARFALAGAVLSTPPLLLLLLNALRVPNCALTEGAAFFGLIVGGSVAVSSIWALLCVILAPPGWRRWALYLSIVALSVIATVYPLAMEPPAQAHHPLIGLFAGSIYDEALSVPVGLIHYRLWHAFIVAAVLVGLEIAWLRREGQRVDPSWIVALAALLAVAAGMFANRASLGMALDREDIRVALGGRHETRHFVIHHPVDTWHAEHIEAIGRDHEFRYEQLKKRFGRAPLPEGERILSTIYADERQKGRLLGMRRTMIARVWQGEMHILYHEIGQPVLTHELAHIFSAPFGAGPLSLSTNAALLPNMGLVEGLAEAVTWHRGELSPHGWSAAMRRLGIAPDVRELVGVGGFYTRSGPMVYTLMGSFCRFLIDEYGMDAFLKAYGRGDFEAAFGVPVEVLAARWEAFVDQIPLSEEALAMASFVFDRPSIFEKRCARRIASLRVQGIDKLLDRRLPEAVECFEEAAAYSPRTAQARLEAADVRLRAGDLDEAAAHLSFALGEAEASAGERAWGLELRGDLLARRGDTGAAARAYGEALSLGPERARRRSLQARRAALGEPDAMAFLMGVEASPALQIFTLTRWLERDPGSALGNYLLGRLLWSERAWKDAVSRLKAALEREGGLPGVELEQEARRLLGICLLLSGEYEGARRAFDALSREESSEGVRSEARDWLERIDWAQGGGGF